MKKCKYISIFILPLLAVVAFTQDGIWTFSPLILVFGIIPFLELFFKADKANFNAVEREIAKNDPFYDRLLYLIVPVQLGMLIFFLIVIQDTEWGSAAFFGRVSSMGLMCGVLGINVGHELGHRRKRGEQLLGEIALLTSLELHFIPYHNSGHHLNVATPSDPATARRGEWLYTFWFRSQLGGYKQAWQIEARRLKKREQGFWTLSNKMIRYSLMQLLLLLVIYVIFGGSVLAAFLMAAAGGILLLETVNYIEHYGLLRKKNAQGRYEKVQHQHSWNSDHIIGRLLLFELSRHSDHHYKASKHYQVLDSLPNSPQMPTGYPGMVLFALLPPLWIRFMDTRLSRLQQEKLS